MTEPEDRLAALFAADEPPARDPAFTAAVMVSVARRRLQRDLARLAALAAAAAAALWAAGPVVNDLAPLLPTTLDAAMLGVMLAGALSFGFLLPGLVTGRSPQRA